MMVAGKVKEISEKMADHHLRDCNMAASFQVTNV
jgi:hypothetical protein